MASRIPEEAQEFLIAMSSHLGERLPHYSVDLFGGGDRRQRPRLPENHLARFIAEVAEVLDLSTIYVAYQRRDRRGMADRNIALDGHFPKGIKEVPWDEFDVIANMSGQMLPYDTKARVLHWEVDDPIGAGKPTYEAVAQQIEGLVKNLIVELRENPNGSPRPARKSIFGLWD